MTEKPAAPSGREKRRSARTRVRLSAQVIIVAGMRTNSIPCQVLDKSKGGMLLWVDRAEDVPDDFYLVIDGQSQKITCTVARRRSKYLGVRFIPQTSPTDVRTSRTSGF